MNKCCSYLSVVVKMQITPRVRWCCMSWRWLLWLMSFCRGESFTTSLHNRYIINIGFLPNSVFSCCSVSRPDKVIFPPPNWSFSKSLREEQDIGPEVQQVYEVQVLTTSFDFLGFVQFFLLSHICLFSVMF